jgi:hypothetical protein
MCTVYVIQHNFIKKCPTCFEPIYGSSSGAHFSQITLAIHSWYTLKYKLKYVSSTV